MLKDLKSDIRRALLNNAALVSLLGGEYVYPQVSPNAELEAYVVFFELGNIDDKYFDDKAVSAEIRFQIDVWSSYNPGSMAEKVNDTMESLGFVRTTALDDYDSEDKKFRKILRYKKIEIGR